MFFTEHLRAAKVDEAVIAEIMGATTQPEPQEGTQAYAEWIASVLEACDSILPCDTLNSAMFDRACCKSGARLKNVQQLAKEHAGKSLEEKLAMLGNIQYMGKPFLNADGDIETIAVGKHGLAGMDCPCWRLKGNVPKDTPMPLSYCACCGGHFRFHYQKALGVKLRLKKVVSSMLNSLGEKPCVFIYEILS